MSVPAASVFAGFWRRLAAFMVDCVILYFATMALIIVLVGVAPHAPGWTYTLAIILMMALYHAGFHSSRRQATPGKKALKIKVTDGSGQRIDFTRAALRYLAVWLSAIPLLLGFAMSAFTARKRALHDIVTDTLVVNEAATPEMVLGGNNGTMPLTAGVWAVTVIPVAVAILLAILAIRAFHDYEARARAGGGPAEASGKR